MKEHWKDIKGYDDFYRISDWGNVINKKTGERMSPTLHHTGYLVVKLSYRYPRKTKNIHSLVWDNFGNTKRDGRKLVVDHKDGNKLNNRIDNLQVLTNRQNIVKGFCNQKNKKSPYTGVTFDKKKKWWRARIGVNGKRIHLGVFKSDVQAGLAYQKAKISLGVI